MSYDILSHGLWPAIFLMVFTVIKSETQTNLNLNLVAHIFIITIERVATFIHKDESITILYLFLQQTEIMKLNY